MKQTKQIKQAGLAHLGLVIASVAVIAALAFVGWWVWSRDKAANTSKDEPVPSSQSQQHSLEPTYEYPADKWLEYKNEKLGFAFRYPKQWSEIDVRFNQDDFFLAVFNNPVGPWGHEDDVYQQAGIELRGQSADSRDVHGEYAKGFYQKDGVYYKVGDEAFGDTKLKTSDVLFDYDKGGIPTLLIKRINYGGYEALELLANLKDQGVVGLNLMFIHPTKISEFDNPAYNQNDVDVMKQIAASFRAL